MAGHQQVHEFKVEMTCGGCSSAVEKVLGKLRDKGVLKVDISLENQMVQVTSTGLSADQLLETIKKTGKTTSYIGLKE